VTAKLDAGSVRTKRTVEGNPAPAIAGIVKRVGAVVLFALVVGFALPAVIARPQDVFSRNSMLIKVHDVITAEEAARKIIVEVSFDHKKDTVTALAVSSLQSSNPHKDVYPISIQPFYLHLISVLRPIEFFCFGICAFVMRPSCTKSREWLTRF